MRREIKWVGRYNCYRSYQSYDIIPAVKMLMPTVMDGREITYKSPYILGPTKSLSVPTWLLAGASPMHPRRRSTTLSSLPCCGTRTRRCGSRAT